MFWIATCLIASIGTIPLHADDAASSPQIEAAVAPRYTDLTPFYPKPLRKRATVKFDEVPLGEVIKWIAKESGIQVVVCETKLGDYGIDIKSELWSGNLQNEPIYVLLADCLDGLELTWYIRNDVLHITTSEHGLSMLSLQVYRVADLVQDGYTRDALLDTLMKIAGSEVRADNWEDNGGYGTVMFAGDSLVVRQTNATHREVAGLLAMLRHHGRQTMVTNSPDYEKLVAAMQRKVSVEFKGTPLNTVLNELGQSAGIPIRIRHDHFVNYGVDVKTETVTLKLENVPLSEVLDDIMHELELAAPLTNNRLTLTTIEHALSDLPFAVYDISDLCQDVDNADALRSVLRYNTGSEERGDNWEINGGVGIMDFPKPQTLVIRNTQATHDEVLDFLTQYRATLPLDGGPVDLDPSRHEIITEYYGLQKEMAADLLRLIPELVEPDSWKPNAAGSEAGFIRLSASEPYTLPREKPDDTPSPSRDRSTLIITHHRSVHDQVADLIKNVREGRGTNSSYDHFGISGFSSIDSP